MTYDVEHLFIYLFSTCVSPLMSCLLRFLVHFLIGSCIFLLMSFKSLLYMLDNHSFSVVSLQIIFFPIYACLFIFFTMFFSEQLLILIKSTLSISFFMDCSMKCGLSKMSSPYPRVCWFSPLLFYFVAFYI